MIPISGIQARIKTILNREEKQKGLYLQTEDRHFLLTVSAIGLLILDSCEPMNCVVDFTRHNFVGFRSEVVLYFHSPSRS